MGWRGTLVLAMLATAAAVLFFATTPPKPELPDETLLGEPRFIDPDAPVKHVLKFDATRVRRMSLGYHEEEITVAFENGRWRGAADPNRLGDFLASLSELVELASMDVPTNELGDYGLVNPARRVRLDFEGDTNLVVAIGDSNPAGTANYVRLDNAGLVTLTGSLIVWEFDKAFSAATGRKKAGT